MPGWPELPMVEAEFGEPVIVGEDTYEISFKSRLDDGTITLGKIIGLASIQPPTIIFEEERLDLSASKIVRKFNHGTPENVRSLILINGEPMRFLRKLRADWKWLIKSEILED